MPAVSIIIVNYYSEKEVIRCIQSIHDYTDRGVDYEIIVVSNSPLGAPIKEKLESLRHTRVIQSPQNGGFAQGCNTGARAARGDFLFLLNPDTRFLNNTLSHLLDYYNTRKEDAIIAPFTYNVDRTLRATVKNHLNWATLVHEALPLIGPFIPKGKKSGHYKVYKTQPVDVVQGSAIFLSKKVYEKLDGMDERFFMYWEENDLCLRAYYRGMKCIVVEQPKIEHKGAVSTSQQFYHMFLIQHVSRKLFIDKHFPGLHHINRIAGILGYSWRTLAALLLWDKKRIKQFYSGLKWYLISYNHLPKIRTAGRAQHSKIRIEENRIKEI